MKWIGFIGGIIFELIEYYYCKYIEILREFFEFYFFLELVVFLMNFKIFKDNLCGWEGRKEMFIEVVKVFERVGVEVIGIVVNMLYIVFLDV